MTAVFSIGAVVVLALLVRLACRHRPDWWITSDNAILCVVSPALILLLTFGSVAIGYRLAHGGLAAVHVEGWIGAAVIAAIVVGVHRVASRWILRSVAKAPQATPAT